MLVVGLYPHGIIFAHDWLLGRLKYFYYHLIPFPVLDKRKYFYHNLILIILHLWTLYNGFQISKIGNSSNYSKLLRLYNFEWMKCDTVIHLYCVHIFTQLEALLFSIFIISSFVTIHYLNSGWTKYSSSYDLMLNVYSWLRNAFYCIKHACNLIMCSHWDMKKLTFYVKVCIWYYGDYLYYCPGSISNQET